ncbi:bifunctional DNA2-NAM7 helicase-like [Babesia duncani]|uniref:Bifunctional DNA2-NAM7 helicase-like n=1 Tax=Babesia duncani TaxID=323732 RepID=A0AAD9PGS4_9APIC|nr:bifunctional DNA2-NAM7 helicase-like [Babesia duncani]
MEQILTSEDSIFERILAFDFFRDLLQDNLDNWDIIQSRIKWHKPLTKLGSNITNLKDYHSSFFPLFLLECLQMLTKAKYSEMSCPCTSQMISCQMSGNFGLVTFTISDTQHFVVGDVVLIIFNPIGNGTNATRIKRQLNGEAVENNWSSWNYHTMFKETLRHCLGFVEFVFSNRILVKILLLPPKYANSETFGEHDMDRLETIQDIIRECLTNIQAKEYHVKLEEKLKPMPESIREYRGLTMLKSIPLKDCIISKVVVGEHVFSASLEHFGIPTKLKQRLYETYNEAQLSAIANCLSTKNVTLIQGPPGTGKTTTIMGIISVIMQADVTSSRQKKDDMEIEYSAHENFKRKHSWLFETMFDTCVNASFEELAHSNPEQGLSSNQTVDVYECFRDDLKKRARTIRVENDSKVGRRILICAPSNAAIDEIVKRLVRPDTGGIFDAEGQRYNPIVTRVGPNIHEDLIEFSLETKVAKLAAKRCNKNAQSHSSLKREIILSSDILCATLSACGSNDLFTCSNCFDTLIVDEATQSVELSTLIALGLGPKRLVLVGDPCQLSATVCSKPAIQLNYHQSLFQRLQDCGHHVNLLNVQYRMDPSISSFPSMYFYQNKILDAPSLEVTSQLDWREFPLLRSTVFYAIDSQELQNETSYVNNSEVDLVCQLLEILFRVLSSEKDVTFETIAQKIAVISPYSAQVQLLKQSISQVTNVWSAKLPHKAKSCQIDVSTVDGFQGMEKDIVIFSAVRTNYLGKRKAQSTSIDHLLDHGILTIDKEPHLPQEIARFEQIKSSYLESIKDVKNLPKIENIIDVSFISDRRRINVAITRACKNLFIVGNPKYLLDHTHWNALYNHYAKTGSLFICKDQGSTIPKDYLLKWSKNYLMGNKEIYRHYLKNAHLKAFCLELVD